MLSLTRSDLMHSTNTLQLSIPVHVQGYPWITIRSYQLYFDYDDNEYGEKFLCSFQFFL